MEIVWYAEEVIFFVVAKVTNYTVE